MNATQSQSINNISSSIPKLEKLKKENMNIKSKQRRMSGSVMNINIKKENEEYYEFLKTNLKEFQIEQQQKVTEEISVIYCIE